MALQDSLQVRPFANNAGHGRLIEVFRGDGEFKAILGEVRQVNVITLSPGDKAGNHFHSAKREILYVQQGWVRGLFRERASGERLSLHIGAGSKVNLMPGVEHVFLNESDDDAVLMEFSSFAFDPENQDAVKAELEIPTAQGSAG